MVSRHRFLWSNFWRSSDHTVPIIIVVYKIRHAHLSLNAVDELDKPRAESTLLLSHKRMTLLKSLGQPPPASWEKLAVREGFRFDLLLSIIYTYFFWHNLHMQWNLNTEIPCQTWWTSPKGLVHHHVEGDVWIVSAMAQRPVLKQKLSHLFRELVLPLSGLWRSVYILLAYRVGMKRKLCLHKS